MSQKRVKDPTEDKFLINLLTTLMLLPVIAVVGGLLFISFGSLEIFSNLWLLQPWPISTPYLILGIIGLPLVLAGIIYYIKK